MWQLEDDPASRGWLTLLRSLCWFQCNPYEMVVSLCSSILITCFSLVLLVFFFSSALMWVAHSPSGSPSPRVGCLHPQSHQRCSSSSTEHLLPRGSLKPCLLRDLESLKSFCNFDIPGKGTINTIFTSFALLSHLQGKLFF